MSTGLPYGSFLNTSGDRYPGVPAKPANIEKYKHVIPIYSTQCDFWLLLLHYDRFHTCFCALCQRCVLNKLASWDDLNIQSSSLCTTYSSRTVHKSWASSNFFIFSFQEDHPSCIFLKWTWAIAIQVLLWRWSSFSLIFSTFFALKHSQIVTVEGYQSLIGLPKIIETAWDHLDRENGTKGSQQPTAKDGLCMSFKKPGLKKVNNLQESVRKRFQTMLKNKGGNEKFVRIL